jgi:hypothetical protein
LQNTGWTDRVPFMMITKTSIRIFASILTLATGLVGPRGQADVQHVSPQRPDCSVHAACLCPWRSTLGVNDLATLSDSLVPKKVARCPGQELCEWHLDQDAGGLSIYHSRPDYRHDPMPIKPWGRADEPAWASGATRHVAQVGDGWIVALDAGEFGSGVWWVSNDGGRHTYFGNYHAVALIKTKVGILAATRIDRLVGRRGEVLLFEKVAGGDWRAKTFAYLDSSAYAAAPAPGDGILVVTRAQLVRVRFDGKVVALHAGHWDATFDYGDLGFSSFYPGSIVATSDGIVWIGMRAVIVRLVPVAKGYREEWLAPKACTDAGGRPTR